MADGVKDVQEKLRQAVLRVPHMHPSQADALGRIFNASITSAEL